jgi:uncharacterized protein YuzE
MSNSNRIFFKASSSADDSGYLYLPKHPKGTITGVVKKTISINDVLSDYKGIPLYLDFDKDGELIGIEISG